MGVESGVPLRSSLDTHGNTLTRSPTLDANDPGQENHGEPGNSRLLTPAGGSSDHQCEGREKTLS